MKAAFTIILAMLASFAAGALLCRSCAKNAEPRPDIVPTFPAARDSALMWHERFLADSTTTALLQHRLDSTIAARPSTTTRVHDAYRTLDGSPLGVLVDSLLAEPR